MSARLTARRAAEIAGPIRARKAGLNEAVDAALDEVRRVASQGEVDVVIHPPDAVADEVAEELRQLGYVIDWVSETPKGEHGPQGLLVSWAAHLRERGRS